MRTNDLRLNPETEPFELLSGEYGNPMHKFYCRSVQGLTLVFLAAAFLAGCASAPVQKKVIEDDPDVPVHWVEVQAKCWKAVERQSGRAGFALVVVFDDVLAPSCTSYLDDLYRRVHGIAGILSVKGVGDEQVVVKSDLDVAVEPFVNDTELITREDRQARTRRFQKLIDPSLLATDLTATALVIRLQPTSNEKSRGEIRQKLLNLSLAAPAGIKVLLVEYPVVAVESLIWHTRRSLEGLEILNQRLAGGGVLEVGISCRGDDCLLDPDNLSSISHLEETIAKLPRVKATRSVCSVLRFANQAVSGQATLPSSADQALQLMAMMDLSSGMGLLVDKHFRHGVVRVHFQTSTAPDYCQMGKALKKTAKENSSDSIRFYVKKPERRGF